MNTIKSKSTNLVSQISKASNPINQIDLSLNAGKAESLRPVNIKMLALDVCQGLHAQHDVCNQIADKLNSIGEDEHFTNMDDYGSLDDEAINYKLETILTMNHRILVLVNNKLENILQYLRDTL